MASPQTGIFALGTASHAWLEFDLAACRRSRRPSSPVAGLREPRTTIGGVNLVAGFRPELWAAVAPDAAPSGLPRLQRGRGRTGRLHPAATQHDVVIWLTGAAYDVVFDLSRDVVTRPRGTGRPRPRDDRLAVPPRPRPHRVHRRHREPDARRGHGGRPRSRRSARRGRLASCCSSSGSTMPRPGRACRSRRRRRSSAAGRSTASSSIRSRRPRTSPAPTRIASARSSGGTSRTARSPGTGRSSSASVRPSGSWPRCSTAWSAAPVDRPTS